MALNAARFNDDEFDFEPHERFDQYKINEAFIDGTIYNNQIDGGYKEIILREVFQFGTKKGVTTSKSRLLPCFNPVPAIVKAYQNVFRGTFGKEIKVAETVDDGPVNPALTESTKNNPLRRLWRWSNLDTRKAVLQTYAANLGCCGIRIVSREATATGGDANVKLQIDHPGRIWDYDHNDEGAVTAIEYRYIALTGPLGEDRRDMEIREVFTKDIIIREEDGKRVFEEKNELGVCPVVLLRHSDDDKEFSRWAYNGAENLIHIFNWLLSNFSDSIYEHIWPQWFASAAGDKPEQIKLGKTTLAYVPTKDKETPPPHLAPLVADLDFAGAIEFVRMLRQTSLMEQCPELVLSSIDALSGQSGETIAKLQIPAEAAIEQAKPNYEDAVKRALKIGLSEGIRIGIFDLGTGTGTRAAADAAYKSGAEDFDFVDRPALPQTVFDKIQQQTLENAGKRSAIDMAAVAAKSLPTSDRENMRLAGYTDEQIKKIEKEAQDQDVPPDDGSGQSGEPNATDNQGG